MHIRNIFRAGATLAFVALLVACSGESSSPPAPGTSGGGTTQPPVQGTGSTKPAPNDLKATNNAKTEYLDAVPMTKLVSVKKGPVKTDGGINAPMITWGGDVATIVANGGQTTQPGSIFADKGLSVTLFREDDFVRQVEKVIAGETPYLRGTMDQIASASEALQDRGIEMVVVYQMTWSTGGDTIVVRSDAVQAPSDLRGKAIGIQRFGPHMLYLATILRDAGVNPGDVKIRWLRELTIPPYDTRGIAVDPTTAMQREGELAAVTVISPDMMALTSGNTVGTGAESSVSGAKLLLSTKTAGHVIADVYAVRKDYFDSNRSDVESFAHGLMLAQERLVDLYNNRESRQTEYQSLLKVSAEMLRDSPQATADIEGLLADATFVGYRGNVQFFTGQGTPRTFEVLTREAQDALLGFGLITRRVPFAQANWDYTVLAKGLRDTAGVTVQPRFNPTQVERVVQERERTGTSQQGVLFQFEILFAPNQADFAVDVYREEFNRVINLAATYPGAIIVVEGHADPSRYAQLKSEGVADSVLTSIRQSAKNLSLSRSVAVRESIITYGRAQNLQLDTSQFTVSGAGIDKPRYAAPKTEQEWRANMRVVFQIIQAEAELERFSGSGR